MKPTKKCTKCEEEKILSKFGKNKDGKHGLRAYCKQCRSEIAKEERKKNQKIIYRFMTNNKGQLPTDYSITFTNHKDAITWYETKGKYCEVKCNRKLYLAELTIQNQN